MIKPIGFILDSNLPPTEKLLMVSLAEFADENGLCWPSKETLSRRAQVSKRTVDKYIKLLAADGWISVSENRGRRSNSYNLNLGKIYNPQPCKTCMSEVQSMLQVRPAAHVAPEPLYNHHRTPAAPLAQPARVHESKLQKPKSDHAWFSAWWVHSFGQIVGEKYAYTKKDAGQVDRLLKMLGLGDAVTRACVYLSLPEAKRFPKGAPTIGGLLCQINEVSQCDDDLIDQFTQEGLLPDLEHNSRLKDFMPWQIEAQSVCEVVQ
jgi:hypothetical protein